MRKKINQYREVVGDEFIDRLKEKASAFSEKNTVHINSTYYGGGVAEILTSLVPLMNDLGIETGWRLLKGSPGFFTTTKRFHNALQGEKIAISDYEKKIYVDENELNSVFTHIGGHDLVVVHDPQPLPLISFYNKKGLWIWRCHEDLSNPNKEIWNYLKQFVAKYDAMVVSAEKYRREVPIPQHIIAPSIDPLTDKNMDIKAGEVENYLKKFGVELDKPIISQVSRFDKWKDPLGVIEAFEIIRKEVDCKLVLLGSFATDDPEGEGIFNNIEAKKGEDGDIIVINYSDNKLVNCLQRASSVAIQKSLMEGFGLTVSEALWKGTPVVATNVGGIPLQIRHGKDGYLVNNIRECAERTIELLKDPKLAKQMGESGRDHIRRNFLITRHLEDYLDLFASLRRG
jgi:trehalose synthase